MLLSIHVEVRDYRKEDLFTMFCFFAPVTRHSVQTMCTMFSRKDFFRLFDGLLIISTRKTNAEPRCLTSSDGHIDNHMEEHELHTDKQWGYRKIRSTETLLKECYMKCGVWNQMKIWSSHLLDNLSNCLMNLKNSGDSAIPVQCSNQLS